VRLAGQVEQLRREQGGVEVGEGAARERAPPRLAEEVERLQVGDGERVRQGDVRVEGQGGEDVRFEGEEAGVEGGVVGLGGGLVGRREGRGWRR
jgi:hypothetical protein